MTAEHKFYDGDVVVYSKTGETIDFGEVVETFESHDDLSDGEVHGGIKPGNIRVRWYPNGKKEVIKENSVRLVDRQLISAKTVRRNTEDKGTQLGYIRGIKVGACVKILGSELFVTDVDSGNLTPFRKFEEDVAVCLDSWIGNIKKVKMRASLRTSNGSRCEIKDVISDRHFSSFLEKDKIFQLRTCGSLPETFYPGQKLRGPLCGLKRASWLKIVGKLKADIVDTFAKDCKPCRCCKACRNCKYVTVTVERIDTESVSVRWKTRAYFKDCLSEKEWYDSTVTGDDLKRLKVLDALDPFDHHVGRLGQRFYYTLSESDKVEKGQWRSSRRNEKDLQKYYPEYKINKSTSSVSSPAISNEEIDAAKCREKTKQAVDPGNGRTKLKCGKVTKVTFKTTSSFAKKKLNWFRKKLLPVTFHPGTRLAVETVCTKSCVTVVWQDGSEEYDIPSIELHPVRSEDWKLFPGDFVLRTVEENNGVYGVVQSADRVNRTARVKWFKANTCNEEPRPTFLGCCEASLYDLKDHPDFLRRVGSVVIKLANFEENVNCFVGQILENSAEGKILVRWVDGATSLCWPHDLLRARERTRGICKAKKKNNLALLSENQLTVVDRTYEFHPFNFTEPNLSNSTLDDSNYCQNLVDHKHSSSKSVISEMVGEITGDFSIIETVPENHKYKDEMFIPVDAKLFSKTVQKEIKLLRSSLPGGIWVRGFEDRLDLFSAMIRGPANTPYEDALFLFDFQLSPDYPKSPPRCHYVSFCEDRLNPNLYECGKVCVSLLGTWQGEGTEMWTDASSLLQVVVSIQGLILVSEPYFNEAGYETKRGSEEGRENSQAYNEIAVLKTLQNAIQMVRNPPSVFQVEILVHFNENAEKMIRRLESWVEASERTQQRPQKTSVQSSATPNDLHELIDTIDGYVEALVQDGKQPKETAKSSEKNHPHDAGNGECLLDFPLIPASKGFCISLQKQIKVFREVLDSLCKSSN